MSTVQRIMDLSDETFASRDALALLAYVIDHPHCTVCDVQNIGLGLGLMTMRAYDPATDGERDDMAVGDKIIVYADPLFAALTIGRQRLGERFAAKAN